MESILPDALMIGVDYELFWTLNPHSLSPFIKAFELKNNHNDLENWRLGIYIREAVKSALDNKVKYPKEPFSYKIRLENDSELQGKLNNQKVKHLIMKRTRILNKRF